jgi:hypothetical protein
MSVTRAGAGGALSYTGSYDGAGAAFDGTLGVSDPTRIEAPSVG